MHDVELYHHGIKGQKWGVRRFQNYDGTLKTARQFKRALNKNDQRIAEEKYRAQKAAVRLKKASKKADDFYYEKWRPSVEDPDGGFKGGGKMPPPSKYDKKLHKLNMKFGEAQDRLKQHEANIAAGEEYTRSLVKDAQSKGFSVSSKDTARLVNRGEYTAMMLMGAPITAALSAKYESGKRYKVSKPKAKPIKPTKSEARDLAAMKADDEYFNEDVERIRKARSK